jgi:hypothetical protein
MRLVTTDLQEAIAAVSSVYCPHDVKVLESNGGIDAVLEASKASRQQVVTLRYSAPVKIDAGTFENLLLFMTCVDGDALSGHRSDAAATWFPYWQNAHGGPISASRYKLRFDPTLGATFSAPICLWCSGAEKRSISMATQIVMDHTGDTRHYFDADDTETLLKAEERFKALTSAGFTAAVRDAAGDVTVTRSFDPGAEETLLYPRLVGG